MARPSFSVRWDGFKRFADRLTGRAEKIAQATEAALFIEGNETITEAKRLTPVDEGVLRASGHVQLPERDGGRISVTIGFGGPAGAGNQGETNPEAVGYAVYVHEDLTARHTVGQAKYLEFPFNKRKPGFRKRLIRRINNRLA